MNEDINYRMKLVQETIDKKNYEQFKNEALELAKKEPFKEGKH